MNTYEIPALPIEAPPLLTRTGISDQWIWRFPNNYGASVAQGPYSYGGDAGLYELAVLKFTGPGDDDSELTYETPITDDVIGWLSLAEVAAKLVEIAALSGAPA